MYELSDHLGNVRALISKGASGEAVIEGYRYGYQGQFAEQDAETGWNQFEARLYDSRVGRWMSTDPASEFDSPYLAMGNSWPNYIDILGDVIRPVGTKELITQFNSDLEQLKKIPRYKKMIEYLESHHETYEIRNIKLFSRLGSKKHQAYGSGTDREAYLTSRYAQGIEYSDGVVIDDVVINSLELLTHELRHGYQLLSGKLHIRMREAEEYNNLPNDEKGGYERMMLERDAVNFTNILRIMNSRFLRLSYKPYYNDNPIPVNPDIIDAPLPGNPD